MYHCWKTHHMPPATFYNLSHGEKMVLTAFFIKEMEEIREQNESLGSNVVEGGVKKTAHISDEELTKLYGEKPS